MCTIIRSSTRKARLWRFRWREKYKDQLPKLGFYNNIFVTRAGQIRDLKLGNKVWQFAGNVYCSVGERGFDVDGQKSFADWARTSGQEIVAGKVLGAYADPGLRKDGAGLISSPTDLGKLHEYLLKPGHLVHNHHQPQHLGVDPGWQTGGRRHQQVIVLDGH